MPEENSSEQSLVQKKIALATSEHAPVIIELLKDCMTQGPLVAKTEWETICNTIRLETQGTMLREMVDLLENIRKGSLHDKKE